MKDWAATSGLLDVPGYSLDMIGWDFPFLSPELKNVYGLRGYVSACVIPEGFTPKCDFGAEIAWQEAGKYAVITITDPFKAAFELIPNAYKKILTYLDQNGIKGNVGGTELSCFERVYEKDGICYMDVHIAIDAMAKVGDIVTTF
ncbi:hypothetical protein D3C73_1061470 [compost metagenome]